MKTIVFAAISALITVALASPAVDGYKLAHARDLDERDVDNAPAMTFVGQAFVDGPNVTLTGTAQSVYEQLLKINPSYDPWAFPTYQEKMALRGFTKENYVAAARRSSQRRDDSLEKRDAFQCNPAGDSVGNWWTQCIEGLDYLENLNGWCQAPPGWGGCARVSCSHGCGIFLCNDNSFGISVWCGNLAGDAWAIAAECEEKKNDVVYSLKGQVFRNGPPAWNTIVKRQSC